MATQVLSLGAAKKAAASRLRIPCDFGDLALLRDGYTIAAYAVTIAGAGDRVAVPAVSDTQVDYTAPNGAAYQISALFDGGTAGSYDVTYFITLDDPDASEFACVGVLQVL